LRYGIVRQNINFRHGGIINFKEFQPSKTETAGSTQGMALLAVEDYCVKQTNSNQIF
jgi:hypothetical protein